MDKAERYRIGPEPFCMSEHDEGPWVEYDDYAALRARLEAVTQERDDARKLQAKDFELLDSPWKQRAELAEATLATARRDAYERAAEIAESHKPSSSFISERYWRGVDEAAHSIAVAIQALIAQEDAQG